MRIDHIRSEIHSNKTRAVATVTWENSERPTQDIYFETDTPFATALAANANAFLLACSIPAMHYGEERVLVAGQVCPDLLDGLNTALAWIRHWLMPDSMPVRLVAQNGFCMPRSNRGERAGSFLTGGIDSLATLRRNHLYYPPEHPGYIKDVLFIYGLEVDQLHIFNKLIPQLSAIADDAGVTLIPVYTNARFLDDDWYFWEHAWEGALLSAVAHIFSPRLTRVSIASTYDISNMRPLGAHPLLDPNYSSTDLRIYHDGITLSRLAKTKLVSEWPVAFQNIRVCNKIHQYRVPNFNCGNCEKCVRTMLALVALGVLDKTKAFPADDVSEDLAAQWIRLGKTTICYYEELILPLQQRGRHDLAQVIQNKIFNFRHSVSGWRRLMKNGKTRLKKLDERYLNGNIVRFKKVLYPERRA